jgi:hypothetical protein
MYKTLIAALLVLISTFSIAQTRSTSYSAEGIWEGLIVNTANPKDIVRVKFSLYDYNGHLVGFQWYYDNDWEQLGAFSGERVVTSALLLRNRSNGFIEINGIFYGNIFKGIYNIYDNTGSILYCTIYLTRTSTVAQKFPIKPADVPTDSPNLFSVPR